MLDAFEISTVLPAAAPRLYEAWLNSDEHAAMTGGSADIDPIVGGQFSAWDGYITGTTIELEPFRRIVQAWRTAEFPPDAPDSRLEIILAEVAEGTQLTLRHSHIPAGQGASYESGWSDNYFNPMKEYFASRTD
jgi:activator of HSP90 ATPase